MAQPQSVLPYFMIVMVIVLPSALVLLTVWAILKRWIRFSLRTLILVCLLWASGLALWWNRTPWRPIRTISSGKSRAIDAVAVSPDGRRVVTAGWADEEARLFDFETGEFLQVFPHTRWVKHVVFTPDGEGVLTADMSGNMYLWQEGQDKPVRTFEATKRYGKFMPGPGHTDSVIFNRDGNRLILSGPGAQALVWDFERAVPVERFLSYSSQDRREQILERTGGFPTVFVEEEGFSLLAVSSDQQLGIVRTDFTGISLWDFTEGKKHCSLSGLDRHFNHSAGFTPDGNWAWVSGGLLWNRKSGQALRFQDGFQGVAFFAEGDRGLLRGGRQLRTFDANDGRILTTFGSGIRHAAITPDGLIVSADSWGELTIWRRTRPESPHGILILPEFWITMLLAVAVLVSVVSEIVARRRRGGGGDPRPPADVPPEQAT